MASHHPQVLSAAPRARTSLIARMAERFGIDADKMLSTLKATAFKSEKGLDVSNEQMMALLVVAEQHGLNPWTKEIYAFPDRNAGIVPVVGVDGWSRIINSHPQFDGMEFREAQDSTWMECVIYRKDRSHPTAVKEWLSECRRDTSPWKSHPHRMLRHKAMIQCARMAFGFSGIYDPDEAERIIEATSTTGAATLSAHRSGTDAAKALLGISGISGAVIENEVPSGSDDIDEGADDLLTEALAAIRESGDAKTLDDAWTAIVGHYTDAATEIPLDVEAAYRDRKETVREPTPRGRKSS